MPTQGQSCFTKWQNKTGVYTTVLYSTYILYGIVKTVHYNHYYNLSALFQCPRSRSWTSVTPRWRTRSSTSGDPRLSCAAWSATWWGSSPSTSSGRRTTGCSTTTWSGAASGQCLHYLRTNQNFRDITWNVEENMILREIFCIQYTMPQKYLTIIRTYYDKARDKFPY